LVPFIAVCEPDTVLQKPLRLRPINWLASFTSCSSAESPIATLALTITKNSTVCASFEIYNAEQPNWACGWSLLLPHELVQLLSVLVAESRNLPRGLQRIAF
jgi:hypothetical protein